MSQQNWNINPFAREKDDLERYVYWSSSMRLPLVCPSDCEWEATQGVWFKSLSDPSEWGTNRRRWRNDGVVFIAEEVAI